MTRRTLTLRLVPLALFATLGVRAIAQTWWNPDYAHRTAISIKNNDASPTPTPTSAEVYLPIDPTMRGDRSDLRVVYYNGSTNQELDSKVFRDLSPASPFYTENLSAGTTGYAGLPAGIPVAPVLTAGDDSGATVTLPFNFPFAGGSTNQVFMSIDGYLVPGTATPTSQYGLATGGGVRGIFPYTSDYTIVATNASATLANMYMFADATQAVFRWEVAESGQSTVIAKFAAILKPDGSIRYVYSDTVTPPSAGVGGPGSYAEMAYGVQVGFFGGGFIHYPTGSYPSSADFSNHADILYTPTSATPPTEVIRSVFRLQQPIASGATSSGQYFIYYGNVSPTAPPRTLKNVFDYVVDFSSAANVVGSTPPDWDLQIDNTMTVQNYQGGKVGLLNTVVASNHPRSTVKASAMPAFLNVETLSHVAPYGGGSLEMAPMTRVVSAASDPNFQGGYAYGVDAFGDPGGSHIVSYVNPVTSADPADMGGVSDPQKADVYANILYRVTGSPGLIQGKNWRDDQSEPAGAMLQVDRSNVHPQHGGVDDPTYTQPGTTGVSGYAQRIAVDYIALREIRGLAPTQGTVESFSSPGPFIQGTLTDTGGKPLASGTVTISNGSTVNITVLVGPTGAYKVTVPAGTYSVAATGPACYESHTTTGVVASASTPTNFALVFGCGTITGVCRAGINNELQANTLVTLIDSNGMYVGSTTSDKSGFFSISYPSGGTYGLGAMSPEGYGGRVSLTLPSGSSVIQNLTMSVLPNGDCEIPTATNSFALGWTTSFDTPGSYVYSQAQNHTPGGHWSMGITDPSTPDQANHLSGLNNPPVTSFNLPVQSDLFDITVSVWVYFTKTGQMCALRLRDNWPLAGGQNRVYAKSGSPPDPNNMNTGGLDGSGNVPINQWYQIRVTVPAGTKLKGEAPTRLQMNMYAMNSNFSTTWQSLGGGTNGTIYFDDWTVTQTIKSSALGKVVDSAGKPISNAYVGRMTDAGGLAGTNLLTGPFSFTDDSGNFTFYEAVDTAATAGAWSAVLPGATGYLPNYGNLVGTAALNTVASPSGRTTITVPKAGVVSIGATGNAGGRSDATVALSVDNRLTTRWDSGTGNADATITYDLGSAKSVDQVEIFWEAATPDSYTLEVDTDPGTPNMVMDVSVGGAALGILGLDITPFTEGPYQLIRLPAPTTGRYIKVHCTANSGSFNNYSIIEMRALSAAATVPVLTKTDAATVLRIAGGLATASLSDLFKYDVNRDGKITAADAVAITKQAP